MLLLNSGLNSAIWSLTIINGNIIAHFIKLTYFPGIV